MHSCEFNVSFCNEVTQLNNSKLLSNTFLEKIGYAR